MSDTKFYVRKSGVSDGLVGCLLLGSENGRRGRQCGEGVGGHGGWGVT